MRDKGGIGPVCELSHGAGACNVLGQIQVVKIGLGGRIGHDAGQVERPRIDDGVVTFQNTSQGVDVGCIKVAFGESWSIYNLPQPPLGVVHQRDLEVFGAKQ